jgi:glycosyltransferase involved in cell wall biosynthesis
MASSVPVVAPDDASFPELIGQTGAGVLYEKGSATTLADALAQLLLDRRRLASCAAAGHQATQQTYNIEHMAKSFATRLAKLP